MRINKSVKYLNKFKSKIIKHLDDTVSVYKLKKSAENQNCRDNNDYNYFNSFVTIEVAKNYIKTIEKFDF